MKVKCSYESCFKHFSSTEAMIAHKKKDPDHSYCDRCDVDCEDDMHFFIHQLGSPAHNCCPVCGSEYKSVAARDIHLEQQHRTSQKLECAGCRNRFTSAAALMFHIEKDECTVIRMTDYQIQRAEKQLEKEAWAQETDTLGIPRTNRDQQFRDQEAHDRANAALGLIDDIPATRADRSLHSAIGGPISTMSLQQFPPLAPPATPTASQPQISGAHTAKAKAAPSDLIELDEQPPLVNVTNLHISNLHTSQSAEWAADPTNANAKVKGWLDAIGTSAKSPQENYDAAASIYDQKIDNTPVGGNAASTLKAPASASTKPGGKYGHITTQPAGSIVSNSTGFDVERYWDVMQQKYACPGQRCNRRFNDAKCFREHLLSDAHVGGVVVCPSCLKRFRTAAAWVSHTESASKKCDIRNSVDFNTIMREITGGVLGTFGYRDDGSVNFVAPEIQDW